MSESTQNKDEHYTCVPNSFLSDNRVGKSEIPVYLLLRSYVPWSKALHRSCEVYVGVETVAKRTGLSEKTVRTSLQKLHAIGWITNTGRKVRTGTEVRIVHFHNIGDQCPKPTGKMLPPKPEDQPVKCDRVTGKMSPPQPVKCDRVTGKMLPRNITSMITSNKRASIITPEGDSSSGSKDTSSKSQEEQSSLCPGGKRNTKKDAPPDPRVVEIIDDLNKRSGKKFRPDVPATIKLVMDLLDKGYTVDDFKKVHRNKRDWVGDEKMDQWYRPKTLYALDHFDDYRNSRKVLDKSKRTTSKYETAAAQKRIEAERERFRKKMERAEQAGLI